MRKTLGMLLVLGLLVSLIAGCSSGDSSADHSYTQRAPIQSEEKQSQDSTQSYDDMYFQDYGTNPYVNTAEDQFSTFALDVDTGSYTLARNYIEEGSLPPGEAVRPEEFINYFDFEYDPPTDSTFAIYAGGGPAPFGNKAEAQLVRIGIKGKEIADENRKRANLTFVIDVSGSMNKDNRIELVKRSLKLLVNQLNASDQIGIVVYGSTARKVLDPTSVENADLILDVIDSLQIEDATNVEAGLLEGYKMASKSYDKESINRVILCSDGVANIGETGPESILKTIEDYSGRNIYLSTFGFGMGNYNDVLMEQLADKGNGSYAYIDDIDEAKTIFQEELTGTLQTIAKDAKIQVEFDPDQVDSYRLIGYENRAIADEDFQNNRVDGGEIGAGHTVTALYEVILQDKASTQIGKVTIRYKDVDEKNKTEQLSEPIRLSGQLSEEARFIASVAEFAEIMKHREGGEGERLQEVLRLARETAASERQDDFVYLVERALEIDGSIR
ncbi:von Willebrand factor type A domain-containing protein [Paenibacillus sp. GCM10027627]|uniref:vWA domain-containing protein n=1 Tax=unclassified Paenibacillus TaxID=185978 RepID=UPI00362904AF